MRIGVVLVALALAASTFADCSRNVADQAELTGYGAARKAWEAETRSRRFHLGGRTRLWALAVMPHDRTRTGQFPDVRTCRDPLVHVDERPCRHGAMSAMVDQERPSPYFGDYPHGAYWSAVAREGTRAGDEEEDYTVGGSDLRIMWDEDAGPLWASDGLLPGDPEWLRRALGLSDSLVAALLTWVSDMTALHRGPPVADWGQRTRQLEQRGRELAERLQTEVGTEYRVWYHA